MFTGKALDNIFTRETYSGSPELSDKLCSWFSNLQTNCLYSPESNNNSTKIFFHTSLLQLSSDCRCGHAELVASVSWRPLVITVWLPFNEMP